VPAARVLHVLGIMNRGGAESMVMNLYRSMDRSLVQFDFAVLSDREGHFDREIASLGGRVFNLPAPTLWLRPWNDAFQSLLQRRGPFRGVHSHIHHFSGQVLMLARAVGITTRISHSHNTQDGYGNSPIRAGYRRYMRALILRHGTHLFACSEAAAVALYGHSAAADPRVRLVRNAIDLADFADIPAMREVRSQLGLPLEALVVGHVGRFTPQKNHAWLLEVFRAVAARHSQAHLVLVGEGQLQSAIKLQSQAYGLQDRVHFLGVRHDVSRVIAAMDVFVLPSLFEGLPVVLVEAQAVGVPCVVSATVTREACIGAAGITFLALDRPLTEWADAVMRAADGARLPWAVREAALAQAGYDARASATAVMETYLGA
jgi:glycosyltransferase EpsF